MDCWATDEVGERGGAGPEQCSGREREVRERRIGPRTALTFPSHGALVSATTPSPTSSNCSVIRSTRWVGAAQSNYLCLSKVLTLVLPGRCAREGGQGATGKGDGEGDGRRVGVGAGSGTRWEADDWWTDVSVGGPSEARSRKLSIKARGLAMSHHGRVAGMCSQSERHEGCDDGVGLCRGTTRRVVAGQRSDLLLTRAAEVHLT